MVSLCLLVAPEVWEPLFFLTVLSEATDLYGKRKKQSSRMHRARWSPQPGPPPCSWRTAESAGARVIDNSQDI